MATMTVTCETDGCDNAGIPIDCDYDPANPPGGACCGVCGQTIGNVKGL
jgi:hypothetical protein